MLDQPLPAGPINHERKVNKTSPFLYASGKWHLFSKIKSYFSVVYQYQDASDEEEEEEMTEVALL